MKKILILIIAVIAAGCSGYDEDYAKNPNYIADIRITLPDMVMTSTRSVDENAVGEIHLFLFGPENHYRYIGSGLSHVRVEITHTGIYTIIAIANCEGIHPGMTMQELHDLTFSGIETDGRIIMSARRDIEITMGGTTDFEIRLTRAISKVSFNIRVDGDYDLGIFSMRLCSVPDTGFVIGQDDAMPQVGYADYDEVTCDNVKSVEYAGIYMPENLKGIIGTITDAKKRGLDIARANSTYLHIRGKRIGKDEVYDYYILLGENTTNNFNVRRNCHYRYDILLKDSPYAETRVYWYSVALSEKDQWGNEMDSRYSSDQEIIGSFNYLDYDPARYDLTTEVVFDMDNWNEVEFNGQYLTSPLLTILPGNYTIRYVPGYFTAGVNDRLTYRIVTTDQFGYSTQKVRNYTCHNPQ